jgi:hypothetical protein
MAAQSSVGMGLTALVWAHPMRPRAASLLVLASVWLAVFCPMTAEFLNGLDIPTLPDHAKHLIEASAVLAGIAAIVSRRPLSMIVGFVGAATLTVAPRYILDSDWDLAGANLAFDGLVIGLSYHTRRSCGADAPSEERGWRYDDIAIFLIVTFLAAMVCTYVLGRHTNSGDEWADTYQAALFVRGRAYEPVPECAEAFRSFWVYQYDGRSFAQYTPGWPLFMAPFIPLHCVWLAAPVALALLAVAAARLARRGAAGFSRGTTPPSARDVRAAGWVGAAAASLGSTMLINGGSRYPHVFVAAMFAWTVEELFVLCDPKISHRAQWIAGVLVGTTSSLTVAARPADGIALAVGPFLYFLYATIRRRVGLRAVAAAVLAGSFWAVLCLVIMHAQVGKWFKTGYSLTELYYPWNKLDFSVPKPDELRASIPLAAGSYCWWPASPALGLAGLAAVRGRARRIAFVMVTSFVPFLAFYTLFEVGRHWDAGYGPRYELPCVVAMAVGTAVIFAELCALARNHATRSPLARGGPLALALTAALVGIVRIAPLVYPYNASDVREHNLLNIALEKAQFKHTIVIAKDAIANIDSLDLTENLPLSVYPDQEVLIARSPNPASDECVRRSFPDWTIVVADRRLNSVWFHPLGQR